MFWNLYAKDDKIKELLNKENVELEEILEQDSLSTAMRNSSNQKLFSYLQRTDVMEELLDWVLTDKYTDHPKYLKFSNAAINIFTNSKPFQQFLVENETFINRIQNFTKETPSSRSCGHFARIIESVILTTKGGFLDKLNDFQTFLIKNITDMAFKDLFILLSTEFSESFHFSTELLIHLVQSINDDNCMFIASTIREIIENDENSKEYFDSEELIDRIFINAIEMSRIHPLFATVLFRLLIKFNELSNYSIVLQKYIEPYEYQYNCSFPYAISVFGKLRPEFFDFFFNPKSCSQLVEAIYQSFIKKTTEEQHELAKAANLYEQIKKNFTVLKTNARLSDLAVLLNNNFKDSAEFDQSFTEFVNNEVVEHIKIRDEKYGGKIMLNSFDNFEEVLNGIKIDKPNSDKLNSIVAKYDISSSSSSSSSSSNSTDSDEDEEFYVPSCF